MRSLLQKYSSVFSTHDGDLGCTNLISHDIPLMIHQSGRGIGAFLRQRNEAVRAQINQLLEAQVIRESSSLYDSFIVLVRKKDGSLFLCVDYRLLNRLLNSKTRKDAYLTFRKAWMHLQRHADFLGHTISHEGVSTDPAKVDTVAKWQRPRLESFGIYYQCFVEGFAKLAASLHKLVANLAATKLKRGSGQALSPAWTPQCEDSFEALKVKLVFTPVLAYANFKCPTSQ